MKMKQANFNLCAKVGEWANIVYPLQDIKNS